MEVIIRAVFGITDPERVVELRRLLPRLSSINPILGIEFVRKDLGPRSPWGRFVRDRDRVDEIVYEEIESRRQDSAADERHDILSLLLSARDEHGSPLTDQELRDELITLLLAGTKPLRRRSGGRSSDFCVRRRRSAVDRRNTGGGDR